MALFRRSHKGSPGAREGGSLRARQHTRPRGLKRLFEALAVVGVVGALAVVILTDPFVIVCRMGRVSTRVRAVFLDAATGEPLEGVWAISLQQFEAEDAWIASRRAGNRGETVPGGPFPDELERAMRTGPDGRFEVVVDAPWISRVSEDGTREPPPRCFGAEALFAQKAGYKSVLIDCRRGRWRKKTSGDRDDLQATADLGEIRLERLRD